jgi:hypothetical protein
MKLFTVHQNTYTEGNFGDLMYAGADLIGVYTNYESAKKIVDDFVPGKYYAQFGIGEQDMFITEIESDIQLREPTTYDGRYYSDDEQEDYPDEDDLHLK